MRRVRDGGERVEIDGIVYDRIQLQRDADRLADLAEKPERVRDYIGEGRLTVCRLIHHAQPPGEGLSWELRLEHRGKEIPIYHGLENTHDLGHIKREILQNKNEILKRLKERTQEKPQEQQTQRRGIGQSL